MGGFGLRFHGARNYTNITNSVFKDTALDAIPVEIQDCIANITGGLIDSHRPDSYGLHITSSTTFINGLTIDGGGQPGNNVLIDGPVPFGGAYSTLSSCTLKNASAGYPLISVLDGNYPLIVNCTLNTTGSADSVWADDVGSPSTPTVLNPTKDGPPGIWDKSFENKTLKAFINSNISLEWFMDVYVKDINNDPVAGATVTVLPISTPALKVTDATGWARGFIVRELNRVFNADYNYNPYNVTAQVISPFYAVPDPTMDMSKTIIISMGGGDILPPELTLPPIVDVTNNSAIINWTVDEPATASVWYGIDDNLTTEVTGSSGSTIQSVTLTNLEPGRIYTFVVNSTDPLNNKNYSYPTTYTFSTRVYIPLYQGWNMI